MFVLKNCLTLLLGLARYTLFCNSLTICRLIMKLIYRAREGVPKIYLGLRTFSESEGSFTLSAFFHLVFQKKQNT